MKKESKSLKSIVKGTFVAGALLGVTSLSAATTTSLFAYEALGSGAEVRSELLQSESSPLTNLDMNCGEKPAKEKKSKTEATKTKDAKCGEAKCGEKEKAKDAKTEVKGKAKTKATKAEAKTKDAKCGEATCGEK